MEHALDSGAARVPEMNYDALASTPRGEVCIRGKTLFSGYYKREDATNEVVIDGWFHTGEYAAVEHLENIYGQVSVLDSIWVYGNSFHSFLVAIVNPNQQALSHGQRATDLSKLFILILCHSTYSVISLSQHFKKKRSQLLEYYQITKSYNNL
ncbi:Long chain acyl-CoA synthetase 5-like protein [Drosera capensis]